MSHPRDTLPRMSTTIKFDGGLEIRQHDGIGTDPFWTSHLHRMTSEQFEAMLGAFPVLTEERIIDGEANTFRSASVNVGGLEVTMFCHDVTGTEADPNQIALEL